MMWLVGYFATCPSNLGMSKGSLVGIAVQARSWAIGSLINLLRVEKLRPTMYGKCGGGGGACAIVALWGKWDVVVLGGGVSTNSELVNKAPSKDAGRGTCLQCLCGGVGRGSIPPKIGGRPFSQT